MARTVRDTNLGRREARLRLKARGKPYWREIERGLHVGYRRLKGRAGTWWLRHYVGNQTYEVESLGIADDMSDADGVAILDYDTAQRAARERMVRRAHAAAGKHGPLTVAEAIETYLAFLEEHRRSAADARARANARILPALGAIEIESLTTDAIRRWLTDLAKAPARLRTGKGEPQQYREAPADDEERRQRRATANRTFTVLRAALNFAWRNGRVSSDAAWRRVRPFENVGTARIRYLTIAEAKRLLNASDPDFRDLARAALETGCRYGELARLVCSDFNPDSGTLAVRQSKSGKPRHVHLTDDGRAFFEQLCAGRAGGEIMLKNRGHAWGPSHQPDPMRRACLRAKIDPPIGFHQLRHTWASLAVMAGVPLMIVARNLGHRDTRMCEGHYAHLAPSHIADAIRKGAPRFGFRQDRKIRQLGGSV
jgi:integrase